MNCSSRASGPDDEGLDPSLLQLFDNASGPGDSDSFVNATLLKLEKARRARLLRQCAGVLIILVVSAFLAPYAARATLIAASWFENQLPAAGQILLSPVTCVCAGLVAWRILRRELRAR